jgi:aspartyl-tRNA(Asn)/glutamyl-tRNA(Gln) amidotransferase subunit A
MNRWPAIKDIVTQVLNGTRTAEDFIAEALKLCNNENEFNALITINENALQVAQEIDKQVKEGSFKGRLAGVPFIAKDNFLTKNTRTTAASNILGNFDPPYSATAIKLLEAEGAVMIAKANLDSFAHGSSTENSDMGVTLNPHDKTRVPGGSSGGSAASVVLGLAPFALGTDTGGSIRLPASFTGSVGYKPTYGLVSRYGVVAMASSTDVIGPITRTVEDAALVLDVLAHRDSLDSTTIESDALGYVIENDVSLKGKKIGIIKEHMSEGLSKDVRSAIEEAVQKAKQAGAEVVEVSIPELEMALAVYYIVMPAEVSSNLSRYDGIRFGYSTSEAASLEEVYLKSRSEGFNEEVKRRIMIGTYVLSSGYYDAYYKKAQSVRTLLINEFNKAFDEVDYLLGPTSPTAAFKVGENTTDPLKMYLADIMTVATNLVGVPAISIPVSKNDDGLPIGLQLMAPARHDRDLLMVAKAFENELGYES